jgi:hypothetical protein
MLSVVNVSAPRKIKGLDPDTVTFPPSVIEASVELKVRPDKAAVLPTFPSKVIAPVPEFNVSAYGVTEATLSIVLTNKMEAFPT